MNTVSVVESVSEPSGLLNTSDVEVNTDGAFGSSSIIEKLYISIGIIGMTGNLFVIIVILNIKSMRKKLTNIYIVNQSVLDFSVSLFMVASSTASGTIPWGGLAGSLYCKIWLTKYPLWSLLDSSTYNLVVLSVERYFEVVHPIRHKISFNKNRAIASIVFAWLMGPIINIYFFPTSGIVGGECFVYAFWPNDSFQRGFIITIIALQFLIPLCTLIFAYGNIAYTLSLRIGVTTGKPGTGAPQSQEQVRRDERWRGARRNTIKTFTFVAAAFVLCWSQNQFYYLLMNLGFPPDFSSVYYHFTVTCVFMNCTVNPFIYVFNYREFQTGVVKLVGKFVPGCVRREGGDPETASTSGGGTAVTQLP